MTLAEQASGSSPISSRAADAAMDKHMPVSQARAAGGRIRRLARPAAAAADEMTAGKGGSRRLWFTKLYGT